LLLSAPLCPVTSLERAREREREAGEAKERERRERERDRQVTSIWRVQEHFIVGPTFRFRLHNPKSPIPGNLLNPNVVYVRFHVDRLVVALELS
jgi:hypothetical protein